MLELSFLTKNLLGALKELKAIQVQDKSPKIEVSQTVSFFGSAYEKMRNAVEYKEGHLLRKAAIERILKRRLLLNQDPKEFTESLLKELLWGKYLRSESISEDTVNKVLKIIQRYIDLRKKILSQITNTQQMTEVSDWLLAVLSCKLEHTIVSHEANKTYVNFIYQWLRHSLILEKENEQSRNILTYLSIHEAYNKADEALLKYHFITVYGEENLFKDFWKVYTTTNKYLKNPARRQLTNFIRRQIAPFNIFETLIKEKQEEPIEDILTNQEKLTEKVETICGKKYSLVRSRLNRAAIRSIIYIFLTKMIVAFIVEIPADRFLEGKINFMTLAVNVGFPPVFMFIIILLIIPPGKANTKRILTRIKEIITEPHLPERHAFYKKSRVAKPLLTFIFTAIYSLTFLLVFGLIIWGLTRLGFNFTSQLIFIFFITVVTFFAYRVKQIASEYRFKEKEGILAPITDFFMLPILKVGKQLSEEIGKINVITFIFDFILEAPFKAVFEVIEEWTRFLRSKREEIT